MKENEAREIDNLDRSDACLGDCFVRRDGRCRAAFFPSLNLPKPLPENSRSDRNSSSTPRPELTVIGGMKNMQNAPSGVRTVDLPRANHYLFLSNANDVIRELSYAKLGPGVG